jgi:hypothetical protein
VDEDAAGLAAAVELLKCSFGTPGSGPVTLPADVPPVPPLPARFLGENMSSLSGSTATPSVYQAHGDYHDSHMDHDIKMESEDSGVEDEDFDGRSTSRGRSDEDDDGVFGRMEE